MKGMVPLKYLITIIILFGISILSFSQVVVEKSKDKAIISGVAYYIHTVKKGETAYSISRAYGITVEELNKENPPAVYGVKEGQSLRIPVKTTSNTVASGQPVAEAVHDETRFIYHSLKPGETVYALSKAYGVSENEIEQSNPGIDINKLSIGAEIAIPRRVFMNDRQQFETQNKRYTFHKVLQGESLTSIAEQYGMTVRQLRRENRDLRFPQVGDYVRIPGSDTISVAVVEEAKADTATPVVTAPVKPVEKRVGFTPVKDLHGSVNVALLLPFYLKENSIRKDIDSSKMLKGKRIHKTIYKADDWIYSASFDFVEMYSGILLAVDTLSALGLQVNLHAFDINSDTIELTKLINSGQLADMDLIIGPVYSHNLSLVAAYAGKLGIPVVSPVPLFNSEVLNLNPTLFMTSASLEVVQRRLAAKVSEYYDHNFVFIHADTSGTDVDVNRFKNFIINDLSQKIPYDAIKFKEFLFYSRSMFDNDSINRLGHALSDKSKNVIIIASEDHPVISETIQDISGLSKKYDVKVFGYPEMLNIDNLDPKFLFDLDIDTYYPYWIDYNSKDVKAFINKYRKKYFTEPSEKSFAWQGYDIAYYFMSGLAVFGKDFMANPGQHFPDLLQTEYIFSRKSENDGYENQKLYMIDYTKEYVYKVVEDSTLQTELY